MSSGTTFQDFIDSMSIIAGRIQVFDELPADASFIFIAESYALHLRKIVEGLAFAALSAFEHTEGRLDQLHRKDPDALLRHLDKKGLLRLPRAYDIRQSDDPTYRAKLLATPDRDLNVGDLYKVWDRASRVLHEQHPKRITKEVLQEIGTALRSDAARLRGWLWSHCVHFKGELFMVQMAKVNTEAFAATLKRPPGWAGD